MTDIFAEIDEAMRQERVAKFWNENMSYIIGFVVLTILLTASFSAYRTWDASVKTNQTSALIALQEDSNFPENILELKNLELRPGLRGIILIDGAGAFLKESKTDSALILYERAAHDTKIPAEFRDMATLMSVRLLSEDIKSDTNTLLARLKDITTNGKSPWIYHAHLEIALILAHKNEDYAAAREYLNIIKNTTNLPNTLYAMAKSLDHVYSLRQQTQGQNKENKETTP